MNDTRAYFGPKRYRSELDWLEQGERVAGAFFDGPLWPFVVLGARQALGRVQRWDEAGVALALATWRGVP